LQFGSGHQISRATETDTPHDDALSAGIAQGGADGFGAISLRYAIRQALLQSLFAGKLRAGIRRGLGLRQRGGQCDAQRRDTVAESPGHVC
jgi:hypothetical protein